MSKRLRACILIICLIVLPAQAGAWSFCVAPSGGGGGGAWYQSDVDGNLTGNSGWNPTAIVTLQQITINATCSITKIAFGLFDSGGASACKIALKDSTAATQLSTGGTVSTLTLPGWNEVTITGVAVTNPTTVTAEIQCDGDIQIITSTTTGGVNYGYEGSHTYASFPQAVSDNHFANDGKNAARVWCQ